MTKPLSHQLYEAIAEGTVAQVRELLAAHPGLLHEMPVGETWLHVAASYGALEIVKLLVELGIDVNAPEESDPATPIGRAAATGATDVVAWLIEHGADVQNRGNSTPLVSAAIPGHFDIVKLVVEAGADLDATVGNDEPRSPLAWAELYGREEIADYLRERGATYIGPSIDDDEQQDGDEIIEHLEATLGEVEPLSLQRIVEGSLPIEILVVRGDDRITLVTSGMSAKPMTVPDGGEDYQYAELMIHLPRRWGLGKKALAKDKNFWPIQWLLDIAQYPHENDTWLGGSHTVIANGEPPEPLAPGVGFTCILLLAQASELGELETSDGRTVVFYTLFPLYTDERDLEGDGGTVALIERFEQHGISDVVKVGRESVG